MKPSEEGIKSERELRENTNKSIGSKINNIHVIGFWKERKEKMGKNY